MKALHRFPRLGPVLIGLLGGALISAVPVALGQRLPTGPSASLTCGGTSLSCSSVAANEILFRSGSTIDGTAVGSGLTNTGGSLTNNLLTGVSGGQTITCGTGSGDGCTITSTSHATKGLITLGSSSGVVFNQANNRLGLGAAPGGASAKLHITQSGSPEATVAGAIAMAIFGAGSAHFSVRDTTNDVEGFAAAASADFYVGTATNHGLKLRTNDTDRVMLNNAGTTMTVTPVVLGPNGAVGAPTYSFTNDTDTGWFINAAGDLRMAVDGGAILSATSSGVTYQSGKLLMVATTASITASTTQTQGQGALTCQLCEVSTCANANDTVTMPAAVAGLCVKVINNGAQTLQIFPASGDQFSGSAVDASITLAAAANTERCAFNATVWEAF